MTVGLQRTSLRLHLYCQLMGPDQWSQLACREGAGLCPPLPARHGQGKSGAAVAGCSSKGAACLVRFRVEAPGGHSQNLHHLFPEWKRFAGIYVAEWNFLVRVNGLLTGMAGRC